MLFKGFLTDLLSFYSRFLINWSKPFYEMNQFTLLLIKKPKASLEPAVISVTKFEEGSVLFSFGKQEVGI